MRNFFLRLSRLKLRTVVVSILLVVLILGGTLFYLWRWLGLQIEKVIIEQFNQQQLMVARKIADSIEFYLDFLQYQLVTYRLSFNIESRHPSHFLDLLAQEASSLKNYGVVAIRQYNSQGQLEHSFPDTPLTREIRTLTPSRLAWARDPHHWDMALLSQTFSTDLAGKNHRLMSMYTPLTAPGASGPEPEFQGLLEMIFDPFFICQLVTQNVRSGKTGYAWIVDQEGIFLAHYELDFIGRHHIQVRTERAPNIGFSRIDEIVADRLLKGQEGTDWYVSGWHREKVGTIRKLIAYTPVKFTGGLIRDNLQVEDPSRNIWGVGVVAPIEEVYGLISNLQLEQGLLTGFFLLVVLAVGLLIIGAVYSWNRILSQEVESKTEALRQSHERLLRSERFAAVGEAAAYVSHEIKNPLMIIGGFAKQLQRQPDLPPNAGEKLRIIVDEVRRLENFLGELRDFTRPAKPSKKEVDLNALVREVAQMMRDAAAANNITIELQLAESLPPTVCDPNQMKQVLINLLKNAMEAIENNGKITVTTAKEGQAVRLAVSDTGKGIPPEILPQIFNPFFTTKKSGTGLGLPVINKIIEDHQGSITVDSQQEQGTTFTVLLPCQA